ncbi:MAG: O-antigen ligase family protein [Bacteroidales bacterium]|nr:O-antigen ligase family protein [Bacteroidales bacterium]
MTKSNNIRDYFLVFLVFGYSIYSHFTLQKELYLLAVFILSIYITLKTKLKFNKIIILSTIYLLVIGLTQTLIFGAGKISTILYNIAVLLYFPFFILVIVGMKSLRLFSNIITFFALVSIVFWILTNLSSDFYQWTQHLALSIPAPYFSEKNEQFFFYTYESATAMGLIRNPGPTTEPGNWAVFLILSLIINLITQARLLSTKNIILLFALITTFSSAGYLGLFVLFSYFIVFSRFNILAKFIVIPVSIYVFMLLYTSLEFMEEKLESKIENEITTELSEGSGRIKGALRSWNVVKTYPLTGRGFVSATKADPKKEAAFYPGYGFPALAAKIGLVGFIFYFSFIIISLNKLNIRHSQRRFTFILFALLALFIQLFSQSIYTAPIFVMIFLSKPIMTAKMIYPAIGSRNRSKGVSFPFYAKDKY